MIYALFLLLFGLGAPVLATENSVLVELYTSQGCSSCPPADKFAGELVKSRADVIVLSLPVTYWDRLGWKDTLANPEFTRRQRLYARAFGQRQVYTPQMIIDGKLYGVGSHRSEINRLIKKRQENSNRGAFISLNKKDGNKIAVSIKGVAPKKAATIWRVNFVKEKTVTIGGGENSNRKITYHHVARSIIPIAGWKGKPFTRILTTSKEYDGVVIFVQEAGYGEILAASSFIF